MHWRVGEETPNHVTHMNLVKLVKMVKKIRFWGLEEIPNHPTQHGIMIKPKDMVTLVKMVKTAQSWGLEDIHPTTSQAYNWTMSFKAETSRHIIESSAQAIIFVPNPQYMHFPPKYVLKILSSGVYLFCVDDFYIKIFEGCWWCVRGWRLGGQQCNVTSWWSCMGGYIFVVCKLHGSILTFYTHQNHIYIQDQIVFTLHQSWGIGIFLSNLKCDVVFAEVSWFWLPAAAGLFTFLS